MQCDYEYFKEEVGKEADIEGGCYYSIIEDIVYIIYDKDGNILKTIPIKKSLSAEDEYVILSEVCTTIEQIQRVKKGTMCK